MSGGERNLVYAILSIGAVGALFAWAVTLRLAAYQPEHLIDPFAIWTFVAGAVGAACGFLSSYERWLGHAGVGGAIRAAIGGILILMIGSVVAGTLILPYYGTMFAPFQIFIAMIETPALAFTWVGIIVCVHKLMEQWRIERDSIFTVDDPIA